MSTRTSESEHLDGRAQPGPASWITQGNLVRATLRLALPMVASALLHNLLSIVDMIFVGRLGRNAIAAVAVSGVMLGLIYMLAVGITAGCTALVANAVGAGDRSRAEEVAAQVLLMAAGLSVVVACLGIPLAGWLLRALGAEPAVVEIGRPYLSILTAGSFAMMLGISFGAAVRGAGDAITPLKVMVVANLVNLVLDPILIFGWLGVPALGVAGSAWASLVGRLVACTLLAHVFFSGGHQHFHLGLRHLRPRLRTIRQIFKIGVFGSGQALIRSISSIALVRIIAIFGSAPLAAYGIVLRLWMTFLMIGFGFGMAAATIVGQNLGAGKPARAAQAGWVAAGVCACFAVCLGAVFIPAARPIITVFNREPEIVAAGSLFLRIIATVFVFTALSVVLSRAMAGAGDTLLPMLVTGAAMLAVRIPLSYALATAWDSATGVWVGMAASNVVQGLLFVAAFTWGRWKRVGLALAQGR